MSSGSAQNPFYHHPAKKRDVREPMAEDLKRHTARTAPWVPLAGCHPRVWLPYHLVAEA